MILTCPACDTKYVVKDGAIPPGGRQVRCASCKHSWHQDPESLARAGQRAPLDFGGDPPPRPAQSSSRFRKRRPSAGGRRRDRRRAQPEPAPSGDGRRHGASLHRPTCSTMPSAAEHDDAVGERRRGREWREPPETSSARDQREDDFVGLCADLRRDGARTRRWPLILAILLLIAALPPHSGSSLRSNGGSGAGIARPERRRCC